MRTKPHPKRSRRPHPLDAEIEKVERELRRLRAIRHSELSADAARDPIKRIKAAAGRKKAWANPSIRAAHVQALKESWTPTRRKAQAKRMKAMRADKRKNAEMLARQVAAQRTPEYRERARVRSAEVWAREKAARKLPAMQSLGAALGGGGE